MVSVRRDMTDGLDIAAQLVRDGNARWPKLFDQMIKEPLCSLRISSRLNEDIQGVATRINGAPQPMFDTADHNNGFAQVLLIVRLWSVTPNVSSVSDAYDPWYRGVL